MIHWRAVTESLVMLIDGAFFDPNPNDFFIPEIIDCTVVFPVLFVSDHNVESVIANNLLDVALFIFQPNILFDHDAFTCKNMPESKCVWDIF